jgi:Tfp pilus assembly protein PilP
MAKMLRPYYDLRKLLWVKTCALLLVLLCLVGCKSKSDENEETILQQKNRQLEEVAPELPDSSLKDPGGAEAIRDEAEKTQEETREAIEEIDQQ